MALRLARVLRERGDDARSLIRRPEHGDDVREAGGEPVVCDLEAAGEDEVAAAIEGADAVVFAAGAGPGSGPERKETVDYGGAVKLIDAAKRAGISRYVIVSSVGADPNASGDDTFAVYLRAKGRADAALRDSGLDYTIVRPGRLTDDPATGRVAFEGSGQIPREDVAAVVAATLADDGAIGSEFDLISGDIPIAEALSRARGGP